MYKSYFLFAIRALSLVIFASFSGSLRAQVTTSDVIKMTYNFEFEKATELLARQRKNGSLVVQSNLQEAFLLRWQYIPIYHNEKQGLKFEQLLESVIEESEKNLVKSPQSIVDLYHIISAGLFLSEYHASKENYAKAIYFGNKLYPHLLTTFELKKQYPEFLFIQGLYLYYIEKFKEKNFFYKSMLWGFKSGDKGLGISLLKQSAELESPSQTEAIMFLAHVNLRHENKLQESLQYARALVRMHPNNIKYQELLVESLTANKLWDEAFEYNKTILHQQESYFRLGGEVFEALIIEKKNQNLVKAKTLFEKALTTNRSLVKRSLHFESICLLGLSRIANKEGRPDLAKEYFDKAKEIAPYDYIFDNHFE